MYFTHKKSVKTAFLLRSLWITGLSLLLPASSLQVSAAQPSSCRSTVPDTVLSEELPVFSDSLSTIIETDADSLAASIANDTEPAPAVHTSGFNIAEVNPFDVDLSDSEASNSLTEASASLRRLAEQKPILAVVYLCEHYALRTAPEATAASSALLPSGHQVWIQDVVLDSLQDVWYQVSCLSEDRLYTGYIQKQHLVTSDADFLAWERSHPLSFSLSVPALQAGSSDISQFPESYRTALTALKNDHPNWIFVPMNTGLDWNYVVKNENYQSRSLVPSSSPSSWISAPTGQPSWSIASEGILKYYLDPRNFLKGSDIFQFEQLTYNAGYHTQEAVQRILQSTFMSGTIPGDSRTYAGALYEIGRSLGVSPFHLACRVYQEQGKGTSPLISGSYPGYEGYYNYFNIGASGNSDKAVIENGLAYAVSNGWNSAYAALYGGSQSLSKNYILQGQDTLYLQKFDVDNSAHGMFWHQYMQNICAPTSEGRGIRNAYANTGAIDNPFVFKIPVYQNMPSSACPQPKDYVFSDIQVIAGNWKYESVNYVYEKGLMTGISGTTLFQPDAPLSRAMFATILYRAAGSPSLSFYPVFSDVPDGTWFSLPILWAHSQGIVAGYPDGTGRFGVNDPITREQIAKMLYEYAVRQGYPVHQRQTLTHFLDHNQISSWAVDYLSWAAGAGIVNGKPLDTVSSILDPKGNATRAEAAAMIMRFLKLYT